MTWGRWLRRAITVHTSRFVFATVSVVLGVAAFVGVSIGTGTLSQALRLEATQNHSGTTRGVYLTPTGVWNARAPATAAKRIGNLDGVASIAMGLGFSTPLGRGDSVYVYGQPVETLNGPVDGRMPTEGADEVAMSVEQASRDGLTLGDRYPVTTPKGERQQPTIVGLLRNESLVLTSLTTSQRWVGEGDVVEGVYVVTKPGVDAIVWADAHSRQTGAFQRAAQSLYTTDSIAFFRTLENAVTPVASAALVIGAFLIYLTISRTVQERQRDHAALRSVGATRTRVLALVLSEAFLIGVVGTVIGIACGLVVARAVANLMSGVFNVSIAVVPKLNAPGDVMVKAVVLGLLAPLVAAAAPAIKSSRQDPAPLLRTAPAPETPTMSIAIIGVAVFVLGVLFTSGVSANLKALGFVVSLVGLVMSGPLLNSVLGRIVQTIGRRLSPTGELAAQRIARRPGRSARTSALLATTLAMIVILLVLGASGRVGYLHTVNADLASDIHVFTRSGTTLSAADVAGVRATTHVRAVSPGAVGSVHVLDRGGRDEFLTVIDPTTYFRAADLAWTHSSSREQSRRALLHPGHALLATTISQRLHKHVGDDVRIQTEHGPRRFRIAGTFAGLPTGNTHAVIVSIDDGTRWFGYHGPTNLWVRTRSTAAPMVAALLSARNPGLDYRLGQFERATYIRGFDSAWSLVALTGVIASGIGLMGLVNTMVMEVVDRRHEIGVLRAIGAHRRDIRRMVSFEALGFGLIAGVVGLVAGTVIGRAGVTGVAVDTELPQAFRFSPVAIPLVLVLAVVAGVVAGRVPARRASSIDPAAVLRSP